MRKRLFIGELGRLAHSGLVRQSWLRRQDGHPGKFGRSAIQANFCRSGIQANFAGQQTRQLLHDVLGLQPRTARSALCSPQSGRWRVLGSASGTHMQMAYWGSTETRSPQREVGLVHEVEVQGRFPCAVSSRSTRSPQREAVRAEPAARAFSRNSCSARHSSRLPGSSNGRARSALGSPQAGH